MVAKKYPSSLHSVCLQSICQAMLNQWKNTYYTNYLDYSEHFINFMRVSIPPSFHDQVFDHMVISHARFIQNSNTFIPSISALVNSIISPSLYKLNLHCLRHIGTVQDEEIEFLHAMLVCKFPYLDNLVEISLKTSGRDFTLPICSDEILKQIGSTCSKLTSLDVSYNHTVTNNGLQFLIPSEEQIGCPKLVKVWIFECSVTYGGIIVLLEGLLKLKFLGYRETGESLRVLYKKILSYHSVQPLELAHLNNMGTLSRTCKDFKMLECNNMLVNIISKLCPKLNGLKVRVNDSAVRFLHEITTVSILRLVYNLGIPSSPGSNTVQYFQLCGTQFVQLSLVCDTFSTYYLKVICEQCNKLKCLYINSNKFNCDKDITMSDKDKCVLTSLEEFKFYNGSDRELYNLCHIPLNIFNYVLHKSYVLTEVALAMRNSLLSDFSIVELFSSIETTKIKKITIQVPFKKLFSVGLSHLTLSMVAVEALIGMCPNLENLGELMMWEISLEDIEKLKRQLHLANDALYIA